MSTFKVAIFAVLASIPMGQSAFAAEDVASEKPAAPPRVVLLDRPRHFGPAADEFADVEGILSQELVRQAFLMAAREELGLATRDARWGDDVASDANNLPFAFAGTKTQLQIRRGLAGKRALVLDLKLDKKIERGKMPRTAVEMEKLSRSAFVDALRKAGFSGAPLPVRDTAVPSSVEKLLNEMTFTSQFSAVRQLHQLAATRGSSAAIQDALARGYANLGTLAEPTWHPMHKMFNARALLYAQRRCAADPTNPFALWRRAYVLETVGAPLDVEKDIVAGDRLWKAIPKADQPKRPKWVDWIDAHRRYDLPALDPDTAPEEGRQFVHLLRYTLCERADSKLEAIDVALTGVKAVPECDTLRYGLCRYAGVGLGHSATEQWMTEFGQTVYRRIRAMPDLPAVVVKIADQQSASQGIWGWLKRPKEDESNATAEFAVRKDTIEALMATSSNNDKDRAEPTWAALGLLIREMSYTQVRRRAKFMETQWSVPADEFIDSAAPLIGSHPLRVYLESFCSNVDRRKSAEKALLALEPEDFEPTAMSVWWNLWHLDVPKADRLFMEMTRNSDSVIHDLLSRLQYGCPEYKVPVVQSLLKLDPNSPQGRRLLVLMDWEHAKDKAEQWERESRYFPGVLVALAWQYTRSKQYADAERCLQAAIKISKDADLYRQLADLYEAQGKEELWLAALEEVMKLPDYGLEHASANSRIAWHFMRRRAFERALPYSEQAAQSYSAWGLEALSCCQEGLFDWEKAEQQYRNESERYEGFSRFKWYLFCRRTNHGDVEAARELVQKTIDDKSEKARLLDVWAGVFAHMEGKQEEALKILEGMPKFLDGDAPDLRCRWNVMHLALIADEAGRMELRDAALRKLVEKKPAKNSDVTGKDSSQEEKPDTTKDSKEATQARESYAELPKLAQVFLDDLTNGGKGELDFDALETLRRLGPYADQTTFDYVVGKYLALHGQEEKAIRYWKQAMASTYFCSFDRSLAGTELIRRDYAPDSYRTLLIEAENSEPGEEPSASESSDQAQ